MFWLWVYHEFQVHFHPKIIFRGVTKQEKKNSQIVTSFIYGNLINIFCIAQISHKIKSTIYECCLFILFVIQYSMKTGPKSATN